MTDNKHFTDEGRDHATDDRSLHAHRGWTGFLAHRWPTALGIAVAALTAFGLRIDAEEVSFLSALVVLMPLVYVGAAVVDRRRFAWVVLLVGITLLVLIKVLDLGINLHPAFLVAALAFLALAAARGQLRGPSGVPLQAAGMLVFGASMLVALYVDLDLGGYLVAAGLIGHAAWDAVHYVRNRVVTRSYAEFCAVLDLLVGAAVLFVLFMS
ncbi:MAG: hypothetical protein M3338_04445 [Actinomycetota bacterium]|nr:hypothetical protein [Actinomycetota bacterium]